jgi:hypothetical protein
MEQKMTQPAAAWTDPGDNSKIDAIRRYLQYRINYRLGEINWAQVNGHDDGTSSVAYMSEIRVLRAELLFLDDIEAGDAA